MVLGAIVSVESARRPLLWRSLLVNLMYYRRVGELLWVENGGLVSLMWVKTICSPHGSRGVSAMGYQRAVIPSVLKTDLKA